MQVTTWWSQQNHIICKQTRGSSESPKLDTVVPLAASWTHVNLKQGWWRGTLACRSLLSLSSSPEHRRHNDHFILYKDGIARSNGPRICIHIDTGKFVQLIKCSRFTRYKSEMSQQYICALIVYCKSKAIGLISLTMWFQCVKIE